MPWMGGIPEKPICEIAIQYRWYYHDLSVIPAKAGIQTPSPVDSIT